MSQAHRYPGVVVDGSRSHAASVAEPAIRPHLLLYTAQMELVGGIESHVLEFCERFSREGWRVTLVCSRFVPNPSASSRFAAVGVEMVVNDSPYLTRPLAKWLWTLAALRRLADRRFDVVYVNGQGRNPATVHRWFRGRVRTVHHHHTACDEDDLAAWPKSYLAAVRSCETVVVCADFVRKRLSEFIGRRDIEVAYCFSRHIVIPARRIEPSGKVVFGYFGRLVQSKGVDWILRLGRDERLADVEWSVWGAESTYSAVDFAGNPRVHYRGRFADEAGLRDALESIDCYCLFSSWSEGLPVSLLEVMGAGRPWIATPQGGVAELAHDPASCVLVSLDDYEQVVAACCAMRDRLRAGAIDFDRQRRFYEARFGERSLVRRWTDVLRSNAPRLSSR